MSIKIPVKTTAPMSISDVMNGTASKQDRIVGAFSRANIEQCMVKSNTQVNNVQTQNTSSSSVATRQNTQGTGEQLRKGSKTAILNSNNKTPVKIRLGLGWSINNMECDLDASAFMLGANGKVIGDEWFVFYGQTNSPDNSVVHSGDNQGSNGGDIETIDIDLQRINSNVKKITFVVTINEALAKGLNFSMVRNAYIRVINAKNNIELMRFELTDYYSNVTSMVVGEVYNHNGQWKFNAVGDGVAKDLAGLCEMYGVEVAD